MIFFTQKSSFRLKPAVITRLVGRDFVNCLRTEILKIKDVDNKGNPIVHEIQRKHFENYVHYQVIGSELNSCVTFKLICVFKFIFETIIWSFIFIISFKQIFSQWFILWFFSFVLTQILTLSELKIADTIKVWQKVWGPVKNYKISQF